MSPFRFAPAFSVRPLRPHRGGDEGIRTLDPLLAGQVLSQLSYTPIFLGRSLFFLVSENRTTTSKQILLFVVSFFLYLKSGSISTPTFSIERR